MMNSNPITALLANEKLTSDNFMKWKSNMNIVLICKNHKFVFTKECSEVPTTTAPKTVREKYDAWILSNNEAKCYMLASMRDVLRKKKSMKAWRLHMRYGSMFGQESDQCRHEATTTFMNMKMKK
ncbi:uncharacterized protein LOC133814754 [Humulus lupulus]|uniref:uncharacterized protein LOC133814754 n=1 Tax=Humulus lupulus TaxID=3486 RepID=UPI002B409436|nr:uncharacterized protein LOC133814754 [Humulus lupulus]